MKLQSQSVVVDTRSLFARTVSEISIARYWESASVATKLDRIEHAFNTLNSWLYSIDFNSLTENDLNDLGFKSYEYNSLVTIWLVPLYLCHVLNTYHNWKCMTIEGEHFKTGDKTIYPEMSKDGYHMPFGVLALGSDDVVKRASVSCPNCSYNFNDDIDNI